MIGEIYKDTPKSSYYPSQEVRDFTAEVKKEYARGIDILTKSWPELNDRSVIEDQNRGQMMFNAYVDTEVVDPREKWKWRGTRSKARNKGIAMHANLTANYLLPLFLAQNEDDEIDLDMSEIMRNIIEWMAQPTVSNYQSSFLQMVFAMETNPVTYLGAEFIEVYQKIKVKEKSGKYTIKEILDEVLSGFKCPIWSASQVLISNPYERNIQKQKCIIKRRWVEKSELEALYGKHDDWDSVQNGIKAIYDEDTDCFYSVKDDDHPDLVVEEIVEYRRKDIEVPFVGGIYMGKGSPKDNPIKHRDNNNAPKYNIVPFGFHRIGEHFFFYKSMMNALAWDEMLYDAMSEIVMNRAILEVEMPIAVSGTNADINSGIVFPNSVVTFESSEAKVQSLLPSSNIMAGLNALRETDDSITEGSVNETISGQLPDASQKAYSVAQAQANAKKMIGAVGKSLAESVVQYGDLMKDIALNHFTVPEVQELQGGKMKLKYKKFFLSGKGDSNKMTDKLIKFDESLIGKEMSDEAKKMEELKMLEESGWPGTKKSISRVNPALFTKLKYFCKVDIAEMFSKGQEYWQPVLQGLYTMLRQDPLANSEWLLRKLLYYHFQSEGEEGINKQPQMQPQQQPSLNMPQSPVAAQAINKQAIGASQNVI
jgi:hypothetical protein